MSVDLIYLASSVAVWILVMEMNSSQDAVWSKYVKDQGDNDKLHLWDAIGIAALGILIAFGYRGVSIESFTLGLFFFFSRAGYFSWRMNMKRNHVGWNHLGNRGWDKIFNGHNTLYFITCFVGMAGCLTWLFKEYVSM